MSMFNSRKHAENTAADLRDRADRNRERAAENARNGDLHGESICKSNAVTLEAHAKLADKAARLLGDPEGR